MKTRLTREVVDICRARLRENTREVDEYSILEVLVEVFPSLAYIELKRLGREVLPRLKNKMGILEEIIKDDSVNEIMVNNYKTIFVERGSKITRLNHGFLDERELEDLILDIAGLIQREFNDMNPILDGRLEDGSRVHSVKGNVSLGGTCLTIRKFRETNISMDELVSIGTIEERWSEYLRTMVEKKKNIFISGGTSTGKTTFLNALSSFIPRDERVVTIEDSAELRLNTVENLIKLECKNANSMGKGQISMSSLIKASLRMRPNRVIVGEVRGEEVYDMLSAMNTGHDGSMSTGHGNSVASMLSRLETMYLMKGNINLESIRRQIAHGIDVMVHLKRLEDGRRVLSEIVLLKGYKNGEYVKEEVFRREA